MPSVVVIFHVTETGPEYRRAVDPLPPREAADPWSAENASNRESGGTGGGPAEEEWRPRTSGQVLVRSAGNGAPCH